MKTSRSKPAALYFKNGATRGPAFVMQKVRKSDAGRIYLSSWRIEDWTYTTTTNRADALEFDKKNTALLTFLLLDLHHDIDAFGLSNWELASTHPEQLTLF